MDKGKGAPAQGGARAVGGESGADDGGDELDIPPESLGTGGKGAGGGKPAGGKEPGAGTKSFKDAFAQIRKERGEKAGEGKEGAEGEEGEEGEEGAEGADERDELLEGEEGAEGKEGAEGEEGQEGGEGEEGEGDGDVDPKLLIEIPTGREGEEPVRIIAPDQQAADAIRSLQNRAMAGETALRVRNEAEAIRAAADEREYEVELDPISFFNDAIQDPNDQALMVRYLFTRPGILEATKGWVEALMENPDARSAEAEKVEARFIKRRERVEPLVQARRYENQNARACVRRVYETIDKIVPGTWTEAQRSRIANVAIRDLQEIQARENVRVTDPKRVPALVEEILTSFGVALDAGDGKGGAGDGRRERGTPRRTGPSGQELRQQDGKRKRAASAGPGAGSPAAAPMRPPKGTMLTRTKDPKTGKTIPSAFDWLRAGLKRMRRAP